MEINNIDIISIEDKEYPSNLREIYNPPICLYIKGNKNCLNGLNISIVGCRECSKYGENVAKRLSYDLALKNINIVSGLARGIDTFAHIGAIYGNSCTIAVLGNGLDTIYPKENTALASKIINKNGAIISEFPLWTKPEKMNFPARNRIISGLSKGVVVVEAQRKSGTLITVDFALEQGRDVFVVPGNITSEKSFGTNDLIKQGAQIITSSQDILESI
jgi:DNA processing protein